MHIRKINFIAENKTALLIKILLNKIKLDINTKKVFFL